MRELILLRHGKSDWQADVDDVDRPLKKRGKRGAQRIGVWLAQQGLLPELTISSPAERAITTAEKALNAMGKGTSTLVVDERVYLAGASELLEVIGDCPHDVQRLLLVGHNPGLEDLLTLLVDHPVTIPIDGKLLPTATAALLNITVDWSQLKGKQAELISIIRARDLPEKFPYPSCNGNELRDRPAYYYRQSSVIPYRVHDNTLEILIVSSRKNNHWGIPKGIKDPGLTPQDSAAKQAREQAGVEGNVSDAALGVYSYKKWDAACTVQVYAMDVSHFVPDDEWGDLPRRRWVAADEAVRYLELDQLASIIGELASRFEGQS